MVVWTRVRTGTAGTLDVWANRYTAGSWGTREQISTTDANSASVTGPAGVAIDASGNAVVVWAQDADIWSNRYTAGSAAWGTAEVIRTDLGVARNPQVASDPSGNALAVWVQNNADGKSLIWSNRYTTGSGWGEAVRVETDETHSADDPQIAIDANGNAVAVWDQQDGMRFDIWANRYTANGWGTAALLENDDRTSASNPSLAICPNGEAMAVWQQSDSQEQSIFSARFE